MIGINLSHHYCHVMLNLECLASDRVWSRYISRLLTQLSTSRTMPSSYSFLLPDNLVLSGSEYVTMYISLASQFLPCLFGSLAVFGLFASLFVSAYAIVEHFEWKWVIEGFYTEEYVLICSRTYISPWCQFFLTTQSLST